MCDTHLLPTRRLLLLHANSSSANPTAERNGSALSDFSENDLLQELIFSFYGIDGKVLRWSELHQQFRMDVLTCATLVPWQRHYLLHLAKLGTLYKQLQKFCGNMRLAHNTGRICLSMELALQETLAEHHLIVAMWNSQMEEGQQGLTLRALLASAHGPLERMRWMVAVARTCLGKKGGRLISCVHRFLHHGDPVLTSMTRDLLLKVCKPLFHMIRTWILEGELDDPNDEFFVVSKDINQQVGDGNFSEYQLKKGDVLWNEVYTLRKESVPSFISSTQAKKILAAGKNINFLRDICHDQSSCGEECPLDHTSMMSLMLMEVEGGLQSMIDSAYRKTSRQVIDVLTRQFKLLEHLKAVKSYLLLGQGDFIHYLMELLEPELNKSPENILFYKVSGILDEAVRTTNARYEDPDVLKRLNANIELPQYPGRSGWESFSLQYNIDGPINTILESGKSSYHMLFCELWRVKRIDWVLCKIWKRHIICSRIVCNIPEIGHLMKQLHLTVSEMVQFVHQMQYYVMFEVLECSWGEKIGEVHKAESLDGVIASHNAFLNNVKNRALVGNITGSRKDLSDLLRAVYDIALELQTYEDDIQRRIELELESRKSRRAQRVAEARGNGRPASGVSHLSRSLFSREHLNMDKANLKTLSKRYRNLVKHFLVDLLEENDASLHLLSSRLDFNGYFKQLYPEISHRYTHYHRRTSLYVKLS